MRRGAVCPDIMRLPRRLSMTRREEFAAVRKGGKSLATHNLVMATLPHSDPEVLKFGLITSRQASRSAVVRNRIRRYLRAILVKHGDRLEPGRYLVLVARHKAAEAGFHDLEEDWLRMARQLDILDGNRGQQQNRG